MSTNSVFASGSCPRYCCRSFLCCWSPPRCLFSGSSPRQTPAVSSGKQFVCPVKRPLASLADELNVRATAALDAAREMPPGVRRAKAMNKAMILRNAVEIHEHFLGKGDAPAR